MTLRLTTLGEARVSGREGARVPSMADPHRLACFIYLAVEGVCARDSLTELFGTRAEAGEGVTAEGIVAELQEALGTNWLEVRGSLLRVRPVVRVDAVEFQEASAAGRTGEALALYRGHFLEGMATGFTGFDQWADKKRASLERLHRKARKASITASVRERRLDEAIRHASVWAEMDPLDDEAQHRLIDLLAASGDGPGALRQFEAYREALAREGLAPLEETVTLVQKIQSGEPTRVEDADSDVSAPTTVVVPQEPAEPFDPSKTQAFASSPVAGPRLVRIVEGGVEGEAYPLSGRKVAIGSGQGDIVFPDDPLLSPLHASIFPRSLPSALDVDARRFVLRDEGSENGVFVRIHEEWQLRPGDVFTAGRQVFRFERRTD